MGKKQVIVGLFASLAFMSVGCHDTIEPIAPVPAPVAQTKVIEPPLVELDSEELAEIAKLDDADQKLAKLQKTYLVSRENHLGSMGVPVKVTLGDKVGFLCCKGCMTDFTNDPAAAFTQAGL